VWLKFLPPRFHTFRQFRALMAAKYASTTPLGPATAAEEAGGVRRPPVSPRGGSARTGRPATARIPSSAPAPGTLPGHPRRRRGGGGPGRHSSGAVTLGTCPASARFRGGSLRNKWSRKSSGGGLFGGSPEALGDPGLGAHGETPGPAGEPGLGSHEETRGSTGEPGPGSDGGTPGPAGEPGPDSHGDTPGPGGGVPGPADDSGLALGVGTSASADRPGSGRPAGSPGSRRSTGVVGDHTTGIGTGGSGAGGCAAGGSCAWGS